MKRSNILTIRDLSIGFMRLSKCLLSQIKHNGIKTRIFRFYSFCNGIHNRFGGEMLSLDSSSGLAGT